MGNKRAAAFSKTRLRNLVQYRDLSDEEFEEIYQKKIIGIAKNSEFETRIQNKIDEFSKDYDIDDLKINDMLTLRALAQAYITLEDYEHFTYNLRSSGLDLNRILEFEKVSNMMSTLRADISKMQNDLGITRKIRKGEKEEGIRSELEIIKEKAKNFYEQKMFYIFCPKCKRLLSTTWFLYPSLNNKLQFVCGNKDCGERFVISSKELFENKGFNISDIPEGLK